MSELIQYKCPNCGGSIEWNSTLQRIKCPYCDTEFDIETLDAADEALNSISDDFEMKWDTKAGSKWTDDEIESMKTYVCDSCGGEILTDINASATVCPYCDSPVVMKENISGSLKPDYVIPFKIDKAGAKDKYLQFISGRKLLPKVFKNQNHIDDIKGIYVPFWLFDADAKGKSVFNATKVRMWSTEDYDYTETSAYKVFRSGSMRFENVPVDGSSQMADELMQSIEPFDMTEAVPFKLAYLLGYLADKYDVTADDNISIANSRIKISTEEALKETVNGYTTVTEEKSGVSLSNGVAKYALYPVWILNTTFNGKKYVFAMNGQTGKMVGNLPVDKKAYWRNFAMYGAGAAAICFVLEYLLWIM